MDPKIFGVFLKERRAELELTQSDLAERLGVTSAAVSKWERGQCLPDIAKFEDLAEALDLNILELFNCKLFEDELPRTELTAVYQQTLETTQRQHQYRLRKIVVFTAATLFLCGLLYLFPIHRIVQVWGSKTFRTYELSDLLYRGEPSDFKTGNRILAEVRAAASQIGLTKSDAQHRYGTYSRYVYPSDQYPDVVSVESEFTLWSAHFNSSHGTMWVCVTQEGKNSQGKTVTGHWNIPSYWALELQNGRWVITGIHEAP